MVYYISVHVSRRRREMYCGHPRLRVCPRLHACTIPRTSGGSIGGGQGGPVPPPQMRLWPPRVLPKLTEV